MNRLCAVPVATGKRLALIGTVAMAGLLLGRPALAQTTRYQDAPAREDDDDGWGKSHIAVDFDFGSAIDEQGAGSGGGGALRLGQEFDLLLLSLTPELQASYHAFSGSDETRLYSGALGGRLAVGKVIEPSIFAHAGIAHASGMESRTAPLIDAGLALDFTLLPLIDLGVHGAYNTMFPRNDGSSLDFVTLGMHAALVL